MSDTAETLMEFEARLDKIKAARKAQAAAQATQEAQAAPAQKAQAAPAQEAQAAPASPSNLGPNGFKNTVVGALKGYGSAFYNPVKSGVEGISESVRGAETQGYNPLQSLHMLGSAAGTYGGLIMTPLTAPLGAVAGAFPKQAEQVKNAMWRGLAPVRTNYGQNAAPADMDKWMAGHPKTATALGDVANIASAAPTIIPAAKIAADVAKIGTNIVAKGGTSLVAKGISGIKIADMSPELKTVVPGASDAEKISILQQKIARAGMQNEAAGFKNQKSMLKLSQKAQDLEDASLKAYADERLARIMSESTAQP